MNIVSVVVVGGDSADRETVRAAARTAWPLAPVAEIAEFAGVAAPTSATSSTLLVLVRPTAAGATAAVRAIDDRGLPAWPVVVYGSDTSGAAVVAVDEGDWPGPAAVQALRLAPELHALRRESARSRGDLLTVGRRVAHDLRTPLNCASTALQALADFVPDQASAPAKLVRTALDAIEESAAIVDRVSFLLKATAGVVPLRPVKMKEVVWAALQRLEVQRRELGATIVEPDSWPEVPGIAAWLEVVWINLIGNRLSHSRVRELKLDWTRHDAEIVFSVRDRGTSLLPGKAVRWFTPFDRMHELDAPRGLGLVIVQRLVELQGGRCGCKLGLENGVCFFFALSVHG